MTKNRIALVIIDTDNYTLAKRALELTLSKFFTKEVLIFSDQPAHWKGFSVIPIKKINSINSYNECIIKFLPKYLKSEFALIIQYDGFVLDNECWSEYFLRFDYIGAPWFANNEWVVGNGGFSLRSKKLIESMAKKLDLDFSVAEDICICNIERKSLQLSGLEFAPLEVARRFSFEWPPVKWGTFGFHGTFNLPFVYKDDINFLLHSFTRNTLKRRWQYIQAGIVRYVPDKIEDFHKLLLNNEIDHP